MHYTLFSCILQESNNENLKKLVLTENWIEDMDCYIAALKKFGNENVFIYDSIDVRRILNKNVASTKKFKETITGKHLYFVLHVQNNHWIVASHKNGKFGIYDSLYDRLYEETMKKFNEIKEYLKQQSIYTSDEVEMVTGPKQRDGVNCGIYVMDFLKHMVLNTAPCLTPI